MRWALILVLAACGGSDEAASVCKQASAKYLGCVKQLLGPEAEQMARAKEDIAACARDDKTVGMYRKCLAETDCKQFEDCISDYARATLPATMARTAPAAGPEEAQPATEVRQKAPAGPPVAWSVDVHVDGTTMFVAWTPDRALLLRDDDGVRLVRDGKVAWAPEEFAPYATLVGNYIVGMYQADDEIVVLDLGKHTTRKVPMHDGVDALTAAGDKVIARSGKNELYELSPAACCAKKVAVLGEAPTPERIGTWRDDVVLATAKELLLTDRHGTTKLQRAFSDDNNDVIVTGDNVLFDDSKGMALLSLPGCISKGPTIDVVGSTDDAINGCIIARQTERSADTMKPSILPGAAVAYNDDEGHTRLFSAGTKWSAVTGGAGVVVGDGSFVYVVDLGPDKKGPMNVVALARATGHLAWQTELAGTTPSEPDIDLALRGNQLAVRVGPKIYALAVK